MSENENDEREEPVGNFRLRDLIGFGLIGLVAGGAIAYSIMHGVNKTSRGEQELIDSTASSDKTLVAQARRAWDVFELTIPTADLRYSKDGHLQRQWIITKSCDSTQCLSINYEWRDIPKENIPHEETPHTRTSPAIRGTIYSSSSGTWQGNQTCIRRDEAGNIFYLSC